MIRVVVALWALAAAASAQAATVAPAVIEADTVWSGAVQVNGDLEVAEGRTLTIRRGTTVTIAGEDAHAGGWNPKRVEWHVRGFLVIEGADDGQVRIGPEGATDGFDARNRAAAAAPWHGIVLHESGEGGVQRSRLRGLFLHGAFAGVQVPRGSPVLESCVIMACAVGVEVGSAYRDADFHGVPGGHAAPEILGCRFAGCRTAIHAQGNGSPDIQRCAFYRCRVAVGNDRPGLTGWLSPPGSIVARCAFVANRAGVVGQAVVRDSIFAHNEVALELSGFHGRHGVSVDRIAFRNNLLHGNGTAVTGDTGVDSVLLAGDPGFAGPLDDLWLEAPALPAALALAADSPARGVAADGGDLGPGGTARRDPSQFAWTPRGTVLRPLLVAQAGADRKRIWAEARAPAPGKAVAESWWVVPDLDGEGLLDLRQTFGGARPGGLLAVSFTAAAAGAMELELNGDVEDVAWSCNGGEPRAAAGRWRLSPQGMVLGLAARAGRNDVVLAVTGWGARTRVGLSLRGEWQSVAMPPPAAQAVSGVVVVRQADGRYVEATLAAPLHWGDVERLGGVAVRWSGEPDAARRLPIQIRAPFRMRLGPLPAEWRSGSVEVPPLRLRGADGGMVDGVTAPRAHL